MPGRTDSIPRGWSQAALQKLLKGSKAAVPVVRSQGSSSGLTAGNRGAQKRSTPVTAGLRVPAVGPPGASPHPGQAIPGLGRSHPIPAGVVPPTLWGAAVSFWAGWDPYSLGPLPTVWRAAPFQVGVGAPTVWEKPPIPGRGGRSHCLREASPLLAGWVPPTIWEAAPFQVGWGVPPLSGEKPPHSR